MVVRLKFIFRGALTSLIENELGLRVVLSSGNITRFFPQSSFFTPDRAHIFS